MRVCVDSSHGLSMSEFEILDVGSRRMSGGPAGAHVLMDYANYSSPEEEGVWILELMRDCIRECGIREVHAHVESFDGQISPPGFAAVVLIDESHVSAHCYSNSGLLAIDVFTCGEHNPDVLAGAINQAIMKEIPNIRLVSKKRVERFVGGYIGD